jgi:hypothetical protein
MLTQIFVVAQVVDREVVENVYVGVEREKAFASENPELGDELILEVWESGKQTERHSKEQGGEWRREW